MINVLNRKISAGWAYAAILVMAFVFLTPAVARTIGKLWRGEVVVGKASTTPEQALSEFEELKRIVESEPTRVEDYPLILTRLRRLQFPVEWYQTTGRPYNDPWAHKLTLLGGAGGLQGQLFNKYYERFRQEGWGKATRAYFDAHPEDESPRNTNIITYRGTVSVGALWLTCYLWTLPLLGLFFAVRLREAGCKVWLEFFAPLRPALATVFWPAGVFVYPNGDATRQLVQVGRFFAMLLTTTMSVFAGGVAKAVEKTEGSPKKQQGWSLQIDGRYSEAVGDNPPNPEEFVRTTLAGPRGYVERFMIRRPGIFDLQIVNLGTSMVARTELSVNAYAGYSALETPKGGSHSVFAGAQVFAKKGRFNLILPVAELQRQVGSQPTSAAAVTGWTTVTVKPWLSTGVHFGGRKADQRPATWLFGPMVSVRSKRGITAEVGCFRDQTATDRCRLRLIQSFSW